MPNRRNVLMGGVAFCLAAKSAGSSDTLTIDYGPAKLDIHNAAAGELRPVMFYIHGGAWQIGSRKNTHFKPGFFRDLGFLFVSIDHRLGPFHRPDRQASDVAAAYQWVLSNIAAHGGDPNRIIVMGHSSGSHLAALCALRGDMPGLAGLILNDIQLYDVEAFAIQNGGRLPTHYAYLFGSGAKWKVLSPASHIGKAPIPPVLIAYSSMPFSRDMSLDFAARLQNAQAEVRVFDGSAYRHKEIDEKIGGEQGGFSAEIAFFLMRFR